MSVIKNTGYSYNDVTIIPAEISDIKSRKECNVFIEDEKCKNVLPIFTAPMSTIVNENNISIFKNNGIIPILPRNVGVDPQNEKDRFDTIINYLEEKDIWVAVSLKEFTTIFASDELPDGLRDIEENHTFKVCIDLANGHMKHLYEVINKAKDLSRERKYNLIIMTGNIANPDTYEWICKNAEVDYIRLNIGSGSNCITASNTSVYMPTATLINECRNIKVNVEHNINRYKSCPKLIADGGIRNYSDVIKALALGADYVMIGGLFTAMLESAGDMTVESYNSHYNYHTNNGWINDGVQNVLYYWDLFNEDKKREFIKDMKSITKESYGMSTKKAQKLFNPNAKSKTSEGCTKYIPVKYTVKQWTDNMIDYLKSAMSYTNKRDIKDFIGNVTLILNSPYAVASVNK